MNTKKTLKAKRHARIRVKVFGTAARPRMAVYRSNTGIYVQLIDDETRKTILGKRTKGKNRTAAHDLGHEIAQLAKKMDVREVVFDRGGNRYHGVISELADSAREEGIKI